MNTSNTSPAGWKQGFWSLIAVQFQGAFSDNALKNLVIFIILGMGLPPEKRDTLIPVVGALFALPFILFSMLGGWLADRYSKRSVTRAIKLFELGIMLFAAAGLGLNQLPMQLISVFLMGVHSALFGPAKYGLLPELVPHEKLSWGNGILELTTFLAIILGTMAGAMLSEHLAGAQVWSGLILAVIAVIGYLLSGSITRVPAAAPQKRFHANFVRELWTQIKVMRQDKALWFANWGNTWFFFLAAVLQMNLLVHAKDVLLLTDTQNGYLQAALAIGIGVGSFAAGHLSRNHIEYRLIPAGIVGMMIAGGMLAVPGMSAIAFSVCLTLLGFFGGFFIVPVSALLQHRPRKENKGSILAAANLLSFVGILLASAVHYVLAKTLDLHSASIFLACAMFIGITLVFVMRAYYQVKGPNTRTNGILAVEPL
jgi:acyl-[acyl-carrier-protein]-phospholipid O-acyltransferase/long-chain-fatty-acid--[acyl-carrier-protein] ligase